MTFNELVALFEAYTGTEGEVEEAQLAMWFNEAQLDLAYDMGSVVCWEPAGGTSYDVPEDCLRIIDSTGDYTISPDNKILLDTEGTVLYYFKTPTPFTGADQDQESELNKALHTLLAMFAASRYFDQESEGDTEESNHATKWMSYYLQGKNTARTKLQTAFVQLDKGSVL